MALDLNSFTAVSYTHLDTDKFFQNLILCDGIDGGGRLIGDQKLRLQGHGNADHDALEHAAGKLVRVFFQNLFAVPDSHLIENFQTPAANLLDVPRGVGGKMCIRDRMRTVRSARDESFLYSRC